MSVVDDDNKNILQMFYEDKTRWSYIFQNFAFITRATILLTSIKKNITYYHVCYEVDNLQEAMTSFKNSIVISNPVKAILFDNRKVAFLLTPIGIVELLEMRRDI